METGELDLLLKRSEGPKLDFKASLQLSTKDEKAEFIKDVIAIANTVGPDGVTQGCLVLGVADDQQVVGLSADAPTEEQIQQTIREYTEPYIETTYELSETSKGRVGVLTILREPTKVPYRVGKAVGGNKKAIDKDDIFYRYGRHSRKIQHTDHLRLIQEAAQSSRSATTLAILTRSLGPYTWAFLLAAAVLILFVSPQQRFYYPIFNWRECFSLLFGLAIVLFSWRSAVTQPSQPRRLLVIAVGLAALAIGYFGAWRLLHRVDLPQSQQVIYIARLRNDPDDAFQEAVYSALGAMVAHDPALRAFEVKRMSERLTGDTPTRPGVLTSVPADILLVFGTVGPKQSLDLALRFFPRTVEFSENLAPALLRDYELAHSLGYWFGRNRLAKQRLDVSERVTSNDFGAVAYLAHLTSAHRQVFAGEYQDAVWSAGLAANTRGVSPGQKAQALALESIASFLEGQNLYDPTSMDAPSGARDRGRRVLAEAVAQANEALQLLDQEPKEGHEFDGADDVTVFSLAAQEKVNRLLLSEIDERLMACLNAGLHGQRRATASLAPKQQDRADRFVLRSATAQRVRMYEKHVRERCPDVLELWNQFSALSFYEPLTLFPELETHSQYSPGRD